MEAVPIGTEDILLFVQGEYSLDQKADITEFEFKPDSYEALDKLLNLSEPQLFYLYPETSQGCYIR